jgi:hypothetical protein
MILTYSLVHYAMIMVIIMIILGCIMFFHIWAKCCFIIVQKYIYFSKIILKMAHKYQIRVLKNFYKIICVHLHNYE